MDKIENVTRRHVTVELKYHALYAIIFLKRSTKGRRRHVQQVRSKHQQVAQALSRDRLAGNEGPCGSAAQGDSRKAQMGTRFLQEEAAELFG